MSLPSSMSCRRAPCSIRTRRLAAWRSTRRPGGHSSRDSSLSGLLSYATTAGGNTAGDHRATDARPRTRHRHRLHRRRRRRSGAEGSLRRQQRRRRRGRLRLRPDRRRAPGARPRDAAPVVGRCRSVMPRDEIAVSVQQLQRHRLLPPWRAGHGPAGAQPPRLRHRSGRSARHCLRRQPQGAGGRQSWQLDRASAVQPLRPSVEDARRVRAGPLRAAVDSHLRSVGRRQHQTRSARSAATAPA